MRGITIKMGSRNSVHLEPISLFINFLKEIGIEKSIIEKYLYYRFADVTTNGTGKNWVSKKEYARYHQEDIDIINQTLDNHKVLERVIDCFVLYGKNSLFPIDVIIYGTVNDFMWLIKEEIVKVLISQ